MNQFKIDTVRKLAYTERALKRAWDKLEGLRVINRQHVQEIDKLETVNRQHEADHAQILAPLDIGLDKVDELEMMKCQLYMGLQRSKELTMTNHQQRMDLKQVVSTNEVLREQVEDSELYIRELKAKLSSQELEAKLTMEKFKIQFNPC